MNAEGKEFKGRVSAFAKKAMRGRDPETEAPIMVTVDIWFRSKRNDLDGPLKLILDSLEGVVYGNDRQVVALHAHKHHHKTIPSIRIAVNEVPNATEEE
jgi:Holliday junction resolvase RusA-like endonuclease